MRLARVRGDVLQVTAHTTELAALMAAARSAAADEPIVLPLEAREHLRKVLAGYDQAMQRLPRPEAKPV